MTNTTPKPGNDTGLPDNQKQRDAYEETDAHLVAMDGLISALDMLEDELEIADPQSRPAKAFFVFNRLVRETMAQIWETRKGEWKSLGGKFASDVDKVGEAA